MECYNYFNNSRGDKELEPACQVALRNSLKVNPGERVLIITNPYEEVALISMGLFDAALTIGAEPTLVFQPKKSQLEFAHESVIAAIADEPEIVISISRLKLGKDRRGLQKPYSNGDINYDSILHYLLYGKKTVRGFWSPGVTRDIFVSTLPIDYEQLKKTCSRLKKKLEGSLALQITSRAGTDLTIGTRGRQVFVDDGDFSRPGSGGNLPAGEIFISPELGVSEGVIVIDGSIACRRGVIITRTPITLEVEGGRVTAIKGKAEAEELLETVTMAEKKALTMEKEGKLPAGMGETYACNARSLGELGIGLNPEASILGNMLVDEKVYGTCHIAIGSNYDGETPALIHLDGLIKKPTIEVISAHGRREKIMAEGKLTC